MGDDVRLVQEVRLSGGDASGNPASPGRAGAAGVRGRAPGREPSFRAGILLEMLGQAAGGKVLLVGEHEGMLANMLAHDRGAAVTWLEPLPGLAYAGPVASASAGNIEIAVADCADTPFTDGEYDAVAAQFTLEYLLDAEKTLAEWARVLRKGGAMLIVTRNALFKGPVLRTTARPVREFTSTSLRTLVSGAGLDVREVRTLIPDLRLPRFYRGDLSYSLRFEGLPYFRDRGMLLFVKAIK